MGDDAGSGKEEKECNGDSGWCSRENVANAGRLLWQSFRESYSSRHLFSFLFVPHVHESPWMHAHCVHCVM